MLGTATPVLHNKKKCTALHHLVQFLQFKRHENTRRGSVTLLHGCLKKWYQIAENVSHYFILRQALSIQSNAECFTENEIYLEI